LKVDVVVAAAGLHVSGVVSVDESQQQPFYDRALSYAPDAVKAVAVPIRRGTQKVSAQVTVVFSYSG